VRVFTVRVLTSLDKFKGSLTAGDLAQQITEGWRQAHPEVFFNVHPIADGGDGMLAVIAHQTNGQRLTTSASDALGRQREVR
jgi:glycerate kinase